MMRWINDWLATGAYDELEPGDALVVDVRHHVDKAGNPHKALRRSIERALAGHQAGKKIIVACDFGISRSNAIAAGILSRAECCSFDQALALVVAATKETRSSWR